MEGFWKIAKVFTVVVLLATITTGMIAYLIETMDMNSILQPIIINVLSGIMVSFLLIFLLLNFLRPSFRISPFICFRNSKYYFKIVNRSIYHAFDAKIELYLMEPYNHTGANSNVKICPLKIASSNMTNINRYRARYHKKDPFALFALAIFTEDEIAEALKKPGTFLEFKLTVRHGLTGLADTFRHQFPNETVIKDGHKFCFGKDLSTMPENQSV